MKLRGGCLLGLVMLCVVGTLQGQHRPMYSQYMFNQLVLNPAFAGSRDKISATALYRHQWTGMTGAPRTGSIYLHSPLGNPRNSAGMSVVMDRLGVTSTTSLQGYYAYRFDLGPGRLAFGLQGGLTTLQNRWSDVSTDVAGDAAFQGQSPLLLVPGVGFGVYYDAPRYYFGVAAPYLLEYKGSGYQVFMNTGLPAYRPTLFHAGCLLNLGTDLLLRPTVLVKYLPHSPVQLDLNANFIIQEDLWIGASWRLGDAVVGLIEYQFAPQFRLGYAYDYGLTDLRRFHQGTHEIMLRYEFGKRLGALSPRYF